MTQGYRLSNGPARALRWMICWGVLFVVTGVFGCTENKNDDDSETDSDNSQETDGGDSDLDSASDSGLDGGWEEVLTGGDTVCARGGAFSFFVNRGTIDKLVIDFMGGGACWDATSCAADSDTFYFIDSVDPFREVIQDDLSSDLPFDGIYDRARDDNPFREWHHVIIPYCTADLHWGDSRTDYGTVQIEHRGATNSRAVLDWVYDNYPQPDQIFVTGCSAGSYGAALWSAYVMQHYPDTPVIQLGDSGAGITSETFFGGDFQSWNAEAAYPDWIPALDPAARDIRITDIYIGIADFYPANFMSEFNYVFDSAQYFYYQEGGGGDMETFSSEILASLDAIEAEADNFASFVPPGEGHCVLPYNRFYTLDVDGTKFADWLGEMLSNGSVGSIRTTESLPYL